jgi:hypothetical protein
MAGEHNICGQRDTFLKKNPYVAVMSDREISQAVDKSMKLPNQNGSNIVLVTISFGSP